MSTPAQGRRFDLLSIGRAGVDLYAEQIGADLEDVRSFAKYVGGCPGNIAVGTARLGLDVAMLTRVGDDGLGRFVRGFLEAEGIDVSQVRADPHHLTGLVILGIQPPDRFPLIFYRENCADLQVTPEDIDQAPLAACRAIVVSGTGLSAEPSRSATLHAAQRAQALGTRVVLDIDWRPTLWTGGPQEARRWYQTILPSVDLAVGTEEEVAVASDAQGPVELLRSVRQAVVMKRGPRGASVFSQQGEFHQSGFAIEILNTLGAGDGFLSGFLRGWLRDWDYERCLTLGNAVGAIVVTRHGCAPAMPSYAEASEFAAHQRRLGNESL